MNKIVAEGNVDALRLSSKATVEARELMMPQDTTVRKSIAIGEIVAKSIKYQGENYTRANLLLAMSS